MADPFPFLIALKPDFATEPSLFIHPYDASTNYATVANAVSNDEYAVIGSHPTSKKVGSMGGDDINLAETNDAKQWTYVYQDQSWSLRSYRDATNYKHADPPSDYTGKTQNYSSIAFLPASGNVGTEQELAGSGHHWGYATCEWLRHCTAAEYVGSTCSKTVGGSPAVTISGYCFSSDTGSLECGRLVDTTDKYNAIATQRTTRVSRCPRGAPATSLGSVVSKRLLVGGCMVADDANYTSVAEVHVPQMCALPRDNLPGCMFPGATNYNPSAVQPSACYYQISGCTDSAALNYNSEAYTEDGSCIYPIYGCTVHSGNATRPTSYAEVSSDTPRYEQRYVGLPLRSVGEVVLPSYGAVLNFEANANVNSGCVIVVEGCMDSTAVNYDSNANVNTGTWCVPSVVGCMMPPSTAASSSFIGAAGTRSHDHDGLALNYAPTATVHGGREACVTERRGCTSPTALNYDPHATVDWLCYEPTVIGMGTVIGCCRAPVYFGVGTSTARAQSGVS